MLTIANKIIPIRFFIIPPEKLLENTYVLAANQKLTNSNYECGKVVWGATKFLIIFISPVCDVSSNGIGLIDQCKYMHSTDAYMQLL